MVDQLREGLRQTVIASIGPTTSQMLQECDLHVDLEPRHPEDGAPGLRSGAARSSAV